jgi:hypothetical protein
MHNGTSLKMEIQQDFRDLLELFNTNKVEYIMNKRATGRKKDLADLEALGTE